MRWNHKNSFQMTFMAERGCQTTNVVIGMSYTQILAARRADVLLNMRARNMFILY